MITKFREKVMNNNFWKTLLSNAFSAFIGDSGAAVINLVIIIILIHLIGNNGYGILVLAQSYMSIMDVLLNIQSWKSVIQYGQKALVEQNEKDFYGYIKIGSILDISTAIIGGIVSIFIASAVGMLLGWSSELVLCAQIFSVTIFSHFAGTPTAILRIFNKFSLVAVQKIISALLKLSVLIAVWLFKDQVSVVHAVMIYSLADIVGNLLLVYFAIHTFRKKYQLRKIVKASIPHDYKEFIHYTLWGTASEIVDLPIAYFDVFIVSFLSIELVAVYKVFQQITSILTKVTTPIYQAIMPQFSELSAKGLKERGYEVVLKIRNAILIIMGGVSLVIGLSSYLWLGIIYGDIYASYWYVLLIFLLTQTILLSYTTIHPYFLSLGKTKQSALYVLIANVIYMVIAIGTIQFGGLIALVICNFIQGAIVVLLKVHDIKKVLEMKERRSV